MSKEKKSELEDINKLKSEKQEMNHSSSNDLLYFFIGIILVGAGLFMLSKRVMIHSSWYSWRIGSFNLSSGTIIIPLIIGIIWYFANPKSIASKIIITLSIIFIVLSIIMSVSIHFVTTSMFDYVLILGMTGAGAGLLLRTVFKKRN